MSQIQVLDRAARILNDLCANGPLTLTSLRASVGLPMSTVSRIIQSLMWNGFVEQEATSRSYRLGARLLFLGARAGRHRDLLEVARPALEQLARDSREDAGLSVLRGDYAVVVDRVYGPQPLKIIDILNEPAPLYCGAFRKVLLAYCEPEQIEKYLARTKLTKFTPQTITNKGALREELQRIRENRYASSFGEYLPDAAGIAAPVFGVKDEVLAAVFVVGPNSRITEKRAPKLATLVTRAADEVMRFLRGGAPTKHSVLSNAAWLP